MLYGSAIPDKLPHADRLVAHWLRRFWFRSSAGERWFGSVTQGRWRTHHFAISYRHRPKAVEPYLSAGALMQGNTFSLHLFESAEVRVNARGEGKKSTEREGGGERNRAVGGKPP